MSLLKAIRKAHQLKDGELNVVKHSTFLYSWDANEDMGWIEYSKARDTIGEHKIIYRMLSWINYI